MAIVFENTLIEAELTAIGYERCSKCVCRASWSTAAVEHFLYFGKDSRQYLTAEFGLRNLDADKFGVEALVEYGHPNFQLTLGERDAATACSMTFEFGRLDKLSRSPWPRIYLPKIGDLDLSILVVGFIKLNLLPIVKNITDLQTYLAFLLADREPHPWFATNPMIRAAQIVAVAAQLGRSNIEIRELLRPYDRQIENRMRHIANNKVTGVDMYVDRLLSDWSSRTS